LYKSLIEYDDFNSFVFEISVNNFYKILSIKNKYCNFNSNYSILIVYCRKNGVHWIKIIKILSRKVLSENTQNLIL